MSFFNKQDYKDSQATRVASPLSAVNTTDLSDFPEKVDDLKKIDFSATSLESIEKDLERYYELLDIYVNSNGDEFTPYVEEFSGLYEGLSKYQLTSEDYMLLRDGLISSLEYLQKFVESEIYGDDGVIINLNSKIKDFENSLNKTIEEINKEYAGYKTGELGKIAPDKSVSLKLLDQKLQDTIKSIDNSFGVFVVRPGEEMPSGSARKPVVIKVVE